MLKFILQALVQSVLITSLSGWGGGGMHMAGGGMHRGGEGDARAACASPLGTPMHTCTCMELGKWLNIREFRYQNTNGKWKNCTVPGNDTDGTGNIFVVVPRVRWRRPKCDRITPPHPLSWPCVSDLLLLKRRELLRAVTLDDSLHNAELVNYECGRMNP